MTLEQKVDAILEFLLFDLGTLRHCQGVHYPKMSSPCLLCDTNAAKLKRLKELREAFCADRPFVQEPHA